MVRPAWARASRHWAAAEPGGIEVSAIQALATGQRLLGQGQHRKLLLQQVDQITRLAAAQKRDRFASSLQIPGEGATTHHMAAADRQGGIAADKDLSHTGSERGNVIKTTAVPVGFTQALAWQR